MACLLMRVGCFLLLGGLLGWLLLPMGVAVVRRGDLPHTSYAHGCCASSAKIMTHHATHSTGI